MLLISQAKMPMYFWLSINLFISAVIKSPLTLLITPILLFYILLRKTFNCKNIFKFQKIRLLFLIFLSFLIISILLAMKTGASDNYFIGCSIFSVFLLVLLIDYLGKNEYIVIYSLMLCSLIAILGIALVLFGIQGRINLIDLNLENNQIKQCVKNLTKPIYVNSGYGSLPWINSGSPSFILAATYFYKDKFGDVFENDGIEGLIRDKYFQSIIIPNGNQQLDKKILNLDISGYEPVMKDGCDGLKVYGIIK
jgi:hypothetical protein